jgi:hypothetical protein
MLTRPKVYGIEVCVGILQELPEADSTYRIFIFDATSIL